VRHIAKAAAGSVPLAGAVLGELADAFIPDHETSDRERWEGDVTDGVNNLRGRVDDIDERTGERRVTLTGAPAATAKYMIERCPDGLAHDDVTLADFQAEYSEFSKEELLDGLGDLENYGFIKSISFIGSPSIYRLTQYGYQVLDEQIMGWVTEDDARAIAAIVVSKRENIRTAELETDLGWPRRRLNPALRRVIGFIGPGRVSQTIQPDYVTRYFSPNNAELAELRRFAAGR
jgi:hypothetical protein